MNMVVFIFELMQNIDNRNREGHGEKYSGNTAFGIHSGSQF